MRARKKNQDPACRFGARRASSFPLRVPPGTIHIRRRKMKKYSTPLGKYLFQKRIRPKEFATMIGVSRQMVYGYLKGKYRPSPERARQISLITGIPIELVLFSKK